MTFKELNITEPILKAIEEKGYAVPTPIQGEAIPAALAKRDGTDIHIYTGNPSVLGGISF